MKNTLELLSSIPDKKEFVEEVIPRYNYEEIRQLQAPVEEIVGELKKEIDEGTYDTIISDDASGRILSLIFREILVKRNDVENPDMSPEEKREALKTFFVAGGYRTQNTEALNDFFVKIRPDIKKRALLVTEYISTGKSLKKLMTQLGALGISYDVASISADGSSGDYRRIFEDIFKGRLIIGNYFTGVPLIYNEKYLSGVHKSDDHKTAHPEAFRRPSAVNEIKRAREDVHVLAGEVLKKVWGK